MDLFVAKSLSLPDVDEGGTEGGALAAGDREAKRLAHEQRCGAIPGKLTLAALFSVFLIFGRFLLRIVYVKRLHCCQAAAAAYGIRRN